jgi:ABC-type dipeptide/oligopeptide/nickel transport system ATPase component
MEDMATYCDNVVVMYQSRIYKSGTVEEIFRDATSLTEVLLNVPQVSQIMTKLKNSGIKLEGNLYTVSRALDAIIAYLSEVVE